jgi:hypothetical protein
MWSPDGPDCSGTTDHHVADGTLSGPLTCADSRGTYRLTCASATVRLSLADKTGRVLTHTIKLRHAGGITTPSPPSEPAPVPAPARTNGSLAYCMSGFTPGVPSPCERKRTEHRFWHMHGYLEGDGACFQCWDEEDDDCQNDAPKRTGFRYLGSSCNGLPHASEGNVREATMSTTRSAPRSVPSVPSVPSAPSAPSAPIKPNPY